MNEEFIKLYVENNIESLGIQLERLDRNLNLSWETQKNSSFF